MKRSEAIKELTLILKTWENSEITDSTSMEIINFLEEIGVVSLETWDGWESMK